MRIDGESEKCHDSGCKFIHLSRTQTTGDWMTSMYEDMYDSSLTHCNQTVSFEHSCHKDEVGMKSG